MDRKKWLWVGIALAVCVSVVICAVYAAKMGNAGGEAELPTGEFGERPMGERPTGDWPGEFGERPTGEFGDMPGMDIIKATGT